MKINRITGQHINDWIIKLPTTCTLTVIVHIESRFPKASATLLSFHSSLKKLKDYITTPGTFDLCSYKLCAVLVI